jgi:hypothetical protein
MNSKSITSTMLVIASVFLALGTAVLAQDDPQDAINEEAQDPAWSSAKPQAHFIVEAGVVSQAKADIDGGGNLKVNRFDAGLIYRTALADNLHLSSSYLLGISSYDFSSTGFGEPWETVVFNRLGLQLSRDLNDKWSLRGGGLLMSSGESGADFGDSITGGLSLGVDYRHSQALFLSAGLAVISQLEDDAQVTPLIAVNWQASDRWLIRFGSIPFSGGAGAGIEGEYKLRDNLNLGVGMLYNQRRFRLDDSGPAPKGVGEENTVPVRLRLGWQLSEKASLHFIGGIVTGGELRVESSNGTRLAQQDYDPAPYLAVRALFRF